MRFTAGLAVGLLIGGVASAEYPIVKDAREKFLQSLKGLSHSPALTREIIATYEHGFAVGRLDGLLHCQEIVNGPAPDVQPGRTGSIYRDKRGKQ